MAIPSPAPAAHPRPVSPPGVDQRGTGKRGCPPATSLHQKHGKPHFLSLGKYDGWARESYQLATTKAYPLTLFRRAKSTDASLALALTEAEARLALAGYRLGESLNAILR